MATHLRSADSADLPDTVAELLRDNVMRAGGYADDAELAATLRSIQGLAGMAAPPPSAELAEVFARGIGGTRADRWRSGHRKLLVGTAVTALMSVSLTGVAAATGSLPFHTQGIVSRVVNDVTPFTIGDGRGGSASVVPVAPATGTEMSGPAGRSTRPAQPTGATEAGEPTRLPAPAFGAGSSEPERESGAGPAQPPPSGVRESESEPQVSAPSSGAVVRGDSAETTGPRASSAPLESGD